MRENRRIISDKLWSFANRLDKLEFDMRICDELIKDLANPLKAQQVSDMPRGGSVEGTTECAVILRERYAEMIIKSVQEKEKVINEFKEYITPLKYQLQQVLRCKYIDKCNNIKIAYTLNYSVDYVKELVRTAQNELSL